jgi:hypothetical protein
LSDAKAAEDVHHVVGIDGHDRPEPLAVTDCGPAPLKRAGCSMVE